MRVTTSPQSGDILRLRRSIIVMKHKVKVTALIIIVAIGVTDVLSRFPSRAGEPPDISGVFIFKKENCSQSGCFYGAHPDFSISYLPDGERVHVTKTADGFILKHIGWKNKIMKMELLRNNRSIGWNHKQIVYKWANWGITPLGDGRESRMLRLFVDRERSLIVESTYRETGLGFFFIPFTESFTHRMKLIRVDAS